MLLLLLLLLLRTPKQPAPPAEAAASPFIKLDNSVVTIAGEVWTVSAATVDLALASRTVMPWGGVEMEGDDVTAFRFSSS